MSAAPTISQSEAAAARKAASAADATHDLYERHQRRILAFCVSRLRDRQEAEDAVQNTFVYAFKLLERGVVPHAELPWLFTIAHNVCRSRKRALWRRGRVEAATDLDAYQDVFSAPDRAEADDLAGLSGALASMPETQRRALLLREWQGLSYAEIAATLSLSQSAVETLLFRARRNLAKQLTAGYDRAAVMLNGFVLVRLARRLFRAGVGTKATAAAVAAGVVAGAGIPLVHDLDRAAPSAPNTTALSATPAASVTRLAAVGAPRAASQLLRPGRADLAAAGAGSAALTLTHADVAVAKAPSTTLLPRRPSQASAPASVTASTSDGGQRAVVGTQVQTPIPPVLPQQPLRNTVEKATSAVSKVVSKTVSQAAQTVTQPLSQTETTASQVVAQADSTVSAVASAVGATVPVGGTTTSAAVTPPAPVAAVQQTVTTVAGTASDAASQLLGHAKTP